MTMQSLIKEVAARENLTVEQAKKVVHSTFDIISESLVKKEKVSLRFFGTFKVVERAGRQFKNPATGEVSEIESQCRPLFISGVTLKRRMNEGGPVDE